DPTAHYISNDGRFVLVNYLHVVNGAAVGHATNTHLYDLVSNTVTLITASVDGSTSANEGGSNGKAVFTANGKLYVLFESSATNLVANDTNGHYDIFLRNVTD